MRWRSGRQSSNIEDRRQLGTGAKVGGIGVIIMALIGLLMGADPMQMLGMVGKEFLGGGTQTVSSRRVAGNDEEAKFVSTILADTEDVWTPMFRQMGGRYTPPKLVLFTDQINSACGYSTAATGPFYCPGDNKVYIDLGFFNELKALGAEGDFARAYVLGHEIGHHVQNELGISQQVSSLQQRMDEANANRLSVLLELQADCYAGVWAHHAQRQRNLLEPGDLEEGLQAAASIGDDRLQRMSGRRINPDAFTHGTSAQRVQWFKTGFQSGNLKTCDTFQALK
ncbi:MAG: neutral zinc metallopeptidase [Thiofilum sp.]|uniref:KPN_02809 family neutral zinc metallopeptidase n=1 Tax=Thiofilum sp. TaxID=2212733 RepID=UPI0025EDD86D|nr:neutral zinc metallopeptidase [Thiofilum sp.]MBK8453347.1 neutral zinc metallopeptidase [Thiofilum sp.]